MRFAIMAIAEQITPEVGVEAELFTVGFDPNNQPIQKPVADMTVAEQCSALAIAKQEMERAHEAAAHLMPLAEINYIPESVEMIYQLLDKLLPAMEADDRAVRLANAVQAMGVN
jgi:hypothetical protein